jgi:hypothetical protein
VHRDTDSGNGNGEKSESRNQRNSKRHSTASWSKLGVTERCHRSRSIGSEYPGPLRRPRRPGGVARPDLVPELELLPVCAATSRVRRGQRPGSSINNPNQKCKQKRKLIMKTEPLKGKTRGKAGQKSTQGASGQLKVIK